MGSPHSDEIDPTQFLKERLSNGGSTASGGDRNGLIILNSPLTDYAYLRRLYNHATFCICADGGANRLHDLTTTSTNPNALQLLAPDLIHGDLDSLAPHVRKQYEAIGVEVSFDGDQYSTDFGKAVTKTVEREASVRNILVLGSLGGRADQGLGLLHELYREQRFRHPEVRFWLFSEASVSTLLQPGETVIHTPLDEGLIGRNIGILPLYGPAVISTKGLEWDVDDWPTEMGGQVSTSNHVMADCVTIKTDNEVLFTLERVTKT